MTPIYNVAAFNFLCCIYTFLYFPPFGSMMQRYCIARNIGGKLIWRLGPNSTKILADLNLAARYRIAIRIYYASKKFWRNFLFGGRAPRKTAKFTKINFQLCGMTHAQSTNHVTQSSV